MSFKHKQDVHIEDKTFFLNIKQKLPYFFIFSFLFFPSSCGFAVRDASLKMVLNHQ